MKVSLVIVLVCLVFCTRSHFTRTANAEQVNFKNYSDDELVDKGYGPIIHGGGGTIYIDETRSDPRYQIEMIRRLKNAVQDLNKTMLESRGVLKELDRNIKSSDVTLKNSDNTLRDLNKNLIKFSTETSRYSNILICLTIVLLFVAIWQVRIAKSLGRQANWINNQKDTAPNMSHEPSKTATEPDTTERKGDISI